ncbi:MAG: hypothetical protein IT306_07745 [Chloroflexi bacterium]|nr:hypothetical protein [Chloroflexota bacterium]
MATQFTVRFDGGELVNGVPCFEPGQAVSGSVVVQPDRSMECRSLTVRLIWFTEGRGNPASDQVAETSITQGRLVPEMVVEGAFQFQLPQQPWSYSGRLVSVIWAIEVNVDVPMAADLTHRERFLLRPRAAR